MILPPLSLQGLSVCRLALRNDPYGSIKVQSIHKPQHMSCNVRQLPVFGPGDGTAEQVKSEVPG